MTSLALRGELLPDVGEKFGQSRAVVRVDFSESDDARFSTLVRHRVRGLPGLVTSVSTNWERIIVERISSWVAHARDVSRAC